MPYAVLGSPITTAQVHPEQFTRALLQAALARGAQLHMGCVEGVELADTSICGVRVDGHIMPADAVVSIRVTGEITESVSRVLSANFLRAVAPATMNVDLRLVERMGSASRPKTARQRDEVLELPL